MNSSHRTKPPDASKSIAGVGIAVVASLLFAIAFTIFKAQKTTPDAKPIGLERSLRRDFELPLLITSPPFSSFPEVEYRLLDPKKLARLPAYIALLEEEFGRYPAGFLRKSGLKSVALVGSLMVDGQLRGGVPDYHNGVFFLNPAFGVDDMSFKRHVIHHNLFHFVEGTWKGDQYWQDPEWIALNPPELKYGRGGKFAQEDFVGALDHPSPGFVNAFSRSAIEEDMAEVFAALRLPAEREKLLAWARDDPFLARKIEYMESFLREHSD